MGKRINFLRRKSGLCRGAVCSVVILSVVSAESAVTNYYSSFSGSADDALHGTAPDVRPGSETFNANAVFKADGSFDWDGSVAPRGVAVLPLTIEPGLIYTASIDARMTAASHDNHGVGLSFWTGPGGTAHSPLGTSQQEATLLLRYQGGGRLIAYGDYRVNANGFIYASGTGLGLTQTLSLKLYTYEDDTPWKVEFYLGDSMVHELIFDQAPRITHVAFGTAHGDTSSFSGRFDSFSVREEGPPKPNEFSLIIISKHGSRDPYEEG